MSFKTQYQMHQHCIDQFGHRPTMVHMVKLAEEVGELAGALVREEEQRDGKEWHDEVRKEAGDVHVVLVNLLSSLGVDAQITFADAEDAFMKRTWEIGRKA